LAALALAVLLAAARVFVKIASGSAALIVVWPRGGSQRSRILPDRFGAAHEVAKDAARSDGGTTYDHLMAVRRRLDSDVRQMTRRLWAGHS